jgi:hypothetical protein
MSAQLVFKSGCVVVINCHPRPRADLAFSKIGYLFLLPRYFTRVFLQPYDSGAELVSAMRHVSICACAIGKEGSGTGCIKLAGGAGICTGVGVTYCLVQLLNASVSSSEPRFQFCTFEFSIFRHPFNGPQQGLLFIRSHSFSLGKGACIFALTPRIAALIAQHLPAGECSPHGYNGRKDQ